jgi:hypothetical protein
VDRRDCGCAACGVGTSGYIEQLPSGSWRAKVHAGKDPLTGREVRFRKTRKTEVEAQTVLGKLLALARAERQPDSDVTVAELLDEYVPVAGWDVSTPEANLGYIRRTIKPSLGSKEVRKVRGPLLGRRAWCVPGSLGRSTVETKLVLHVDLCRLPVLAGCTPALGRCSFRQTRLRQVTTHRWKSQASSAFERL